VAPACENGQSSSFSPRRNWREISSKKAMPVFSGMNLIGGLLFGSIGFVAFIYGKRMQIWKPMFLGLALMAYPYFVSNDIALFAIGAVGTAALFLFRD
jgi:glucose uptake protein GlcU